MYIYIYSIDIYFLVFLSFLTPLFSQVLRDGKEVQVPVPTVVAGDIAACLDMASIYERHGRAARGWMQVHRNGIIQMAPFPSLFIQDTSPLREP